VQSLEQCWIQNPVRVQETASDRARFICDDLFGF